jgi:hypothetical protein
MAYGFRTNTDTHGDRNTYEHANGNPNALGYSYPFGHTHTFTERNTDP